MSYIQVYIEPQVLINHLEVTIYIFFFFLHLLFKPTSVNVQ